MNFIRSFQFWVCMPKIFKPAWYSMRFMLFNIIYLFIHFLEPDSWAINKSMLSMAVLLGLRAVREKLDKLLNEEV